jgi:predicted  nucleic acid-binding Zn-ribbon protein
MTETVKPSLYLCSKCGHVFRARVNSGKPKRCNRCGSWQVSPTENAVEEMNGYAVFTDDDLDSQVQEIYNALDEGKSINTIIKEKKVSPSLTAFVSQCFILNSKLQKELDRLKPENKSPSNKKETKVVEVQIV